MPRTVDRSIAKMIAYKRITTGSAALCFGVALIIAAVVHGTAPTPGLGLALLIFFGGGVWTLRDGLRLRRELARDLAGAAQPASTTASPQEQSPQ
jgi:hypothetical protein